MGGYGSGARGGIENILRNAHAYTEMNISQFGKEEKKSRDQVSSVAFRKEFKAAIGREYVKKRMERRDE